MTLKTRESLLHYAKQLGRTCFKGCCQHFYMLNNPAIYRILGLLRRALSFVIAKLGYGECEEFWRDWHRLIPSLG